jgi:hypothetical protein
MEIVEYSALSEIIFYTILENQYHGDWVIIMQSYTV